MAQEGGGAGTGGGMGGSGGGGMDMSKLGMPQKIVGGSAAVFVIWTFLPLWYRACTPSIQGFGGGCAGVNGFRFPIIIGFLAAIAALAGVVMTAMGTKMPEMQIKPGLVQLILGAVGVVATALGILIKPGAFGFSVPIGFGLWIGLVVSLVWAYGAFMWSKET